MDKTIFESQLAAYIEVVKEIAKAYYGTDVTVDREDGNRYVKIVVRGNGVHTFVDKKNGDILKSGSYKAPQKNGVRGNIGAPDHGASKVDHYGAKYLR